MPSKTEKQKRFFGAVMGAKKGQKKVSGEAKKVAKEMPKKKIEEFLKTEDEDEQSISKKMKKDGKATLEGPKVKERKHFAPPTKKHKDDMKYDRKEGKKVDLQESASIIKFIEAIMTKDHAEAHAYLKNTINQKIQQQISKEIEKPLF
jgi:hypothetical protein